MRLIDADELTEMVWRERLDTRERIANLIARQPTIKSTAKHGRWMYVGSVRSWDEIKCSACNSAFSTEDRDLILNWDFCPHCGARMGGDK